MFWWIWTNFERKSYFFQDCIKQNCGMYHIFWKYWGCSLRDCSHTKSYEIFFEVHTHVMITEKKKLRYFQKKLRNSLVHISVKTHIFQWFLWLDQRKVPQIFFYASKTYKISQMFSKHIGLADQGKILMK